MSSISSNQKKNPFVVLKLKNFTSNVLERTAQSGSDEDWNYFLNTKRIVDSPKFETLTLLTSIIYGVSIGSAPLERAINFIDAFGERLKSESSNSYRLNELSKSLLLPNYHEKFNKNTLEDEIKIFHKLISLDPNFIFLTKDKRPLLAKYQYQIVKLLENGVLEMMPLLEDNFDLIKKYLNQDKKEIFNKEFLEFSAFICNGFKKIDLILDKSESLRFTEKVSSFFEGFRGPLPTELFRKENFSEKFTNLLLNKADFSSTDNSSWSICRYDKFWEANFKNDRLSYVPNTIVRSVFYSNYESSTILTDFQKRFALDHQTSPISSDVFLDRVGMTLIHAIKSPSFKANLNLYTKDLNYGFKNFKLPFTPQNISKNFVLGMALKSMIENKSEIIFPEILEGKTLEANSISYVVAQINNSEHFRKIFESYTNGNSSGLLQQIVQQVDLAPSCIQNRLKIQ